jgi:hypothetical protein
MDQLNCHFAQMSPPLHFLCVNRTLARRKRTEKKTSPLSLSQKLITQMETSLELRFYFIFHALGCRFAARNLFISRAQTLFI